MSSISEKLKSLGVQRGVQNLKLPPAHNPHAVESVVSGRFQEAAYGSVFLTDKRVSVGAPHGHGPLCLDAPLDEVAIWAGEPNLVQFPVNAFAFLDTETTGLGSGAGTFAFMVGVARYEGDSFHLVQFFMREPGEEAAMLVAVREFLGPCQALVTFNGKGFDAPLLDARYRLNGAESPLVDLAHLDLLPLARRLWRGRLASRSLSSLEANILGVSRAGEDVPGWLIPSLYIDYLHSGDARPLKGVFYHNEVDLLSMVVLLNHIAGELANPFHQAVPALDLIAMGKRFEATGQVERAAQFYVEGLRRALSDGERADAIRRLSFLYKKSAQWAQAVELWQTAAAAGQIYAHIELAKYYEHHVRDYPQAIVWAQRAVECAHAPGFPRWEQVACSPELEQRLARLSRKAGR